MKRVGVSGLLAGVALAASLGWAAAAQANPAVTSNIFGAGGGLGGPQDIVLTTGGTFDLDTLDLALGGLNPHGPQVIPVVATFADTTTSSFDLTVGGWHTFDLDLTGLASLTFTPPYYGGDDYGLLAFDNIHYSNAGGPGVVDFEDQIAGTPVYTDLNSGGGNFSFYWGVIYGPANPLDFPTPVPEPGVWAMMVLGLAACGAMLRRARILALSEAV